MINTYNLFYKDKIIKGDSVASYLKVVYLASMQGEVVYLDFALVNILTIAYSENKDIKTQQGIDHPIVTDAILAKPGKLTLEHRIGFRLLDQFLLNEVKDSFRLGLR